MYPNPYALKGLSLVERGPPYLLELEYHTGEVRLMLKDLNGSTAQVYDLACVSSSPPPFLAEDGERRLYLTMSAQHVHQFNESSYFSRFHRRLTPLAQETVAPVGQQRALGFPTVSK